MKEKRLQSDDSIVRTYQKPVIVNKGKLARFAGSPLGSVLDNPLNLPGQ